MLISFGLSFAPKIQSHFDINNFKLDSSKKDRPEKEKRRILSTPPE